MRGLMPYQLWCPELHHQFQDPELYSHLHAGHIRSSLPLPSDFSGNCAKGQAFLHSCKLYMQLAGDQFSGDKEMINWTYLYIKSNQAVFFVNRMLWFKAQVGSPRYFMWLEFRFAFIAKFCPQNKTQKVWPWSSSSNMDSSRTFRTSSHSSQ